MIQSTPEGNQTLFDLMPVEILLQLTALAIFTTHYWDILPRHVVFEFIAIVISVNLVRFCLVFTLRYFGNTKADGLGKHATISFFAGNILAGLSWGAGFVLLSMNQPQFSLSDSIVPVLMAGVVMASLAGSALWSGLFISFAIPALLTPLAFLVYQASYAETTIWGQLMLVSLLMFWGATRSEKSFRRYRQLGRQNIKLVQALAVAKENSEVHALALERTHCNLKKEMLERKAVEKKIRASEKETARILYDMQDTYFQVDSRGLIKRLSPSIQTLTGHSTKSLINSRFIDLFTLPWEYKALLEKLNMQSGSIQSYEARLKNTLGHDIWVSFNVHYSSNGSDKTQGFEGTARDITDNKNAAENLFQEKERLHVTLESIGDGVITTNIKGNVVYLNPVAEKMTGWDEAEAKGKPLNDILTLTDENNRRPVTIPLTKWLQQKCCAQLSNPATLINKTLDKEFTIELSGSPLRDSENTTIGAVFVFHNVTKLRTLTKQLTYQATHDSLTGLINRREFESRLEQAIKSVRKSEKNHAILYVDLDRFKTVNDTCGHHVGDELLKKLTVRIQGLLRESDTLARLGGDEFGILLIGCPPKKAARIAETIRASVERYRFTWEEHTFRVGTSIGLAPITTKTHDVTELLRAADSACYEAKEAGRNRVHLYRQSNKAIARQQEQVQWVQRIHLALKKQLFELYFQPIVAVNNVQGDFIGGELLVRMVDDKKPSPHNSIPPNAFIPSAERYQLMPLVDRWVISKSFSLLDKHKHVLDTWNMCSINLSGQSLGNIGVLDHIIALLKKTQIPANRLCFEITESVLISNFDHAHEFMATLQKLGCQFALDDFGTGLSSFSYLKNLPTDYVKLDSELVRNIAKDKTSYAMVKAINQVAHAMNIKTIAKHVETTNTLQALQKMSVDYAQGFVIAPPKAFPVIPPSITKAS
ncbi:MAG: EAL domain-containing protein [Gammaproteobacteria bacterium]|nr:EAL domain-containing protein [Gammaproteobacteria bacterium]